MQAEKQNNPELAKVAEMIADIKFAMLTTAEEDGTLRSRPMSTMQMDAEGNLWFFTSVSSGKVDEAMSQRHVAVNYARADKQDYVSISGTASVVRDKSKMQALWTPWIKPWFPDGLADPALVLLKVSIDEYEFWDAPGSAVKRGYGLAKALVTGKTDALGENRRGSLH
ncbi:MAG: Pyridoxamine 5-phosphate oxidase-related, FMN-binding protein [Paucimonas sp.]|nr:Pyridoxamine 5-phosphate oxidase-related, FMN-binding protein [Paucimonas sp.]